MALTNAEKQRRWREKRNARADVLTGTPKEIADGLLQTLGVEQAGKVARALDKRLRNLNPDCTACHGSGFIPVRFTTACGMHLYNSSWPCDCGETAQSLAPDA